MDAKTWQFIRDIVRTELATGQLTPAQKRAIKDWLIFTDNKDPKDDSKNK